MLFLFGGDDAKRQRLLYALARLHGNQDFAVVAEWLGLELEAGKTRLMHADSTREFRLEQGCCCALDEVLTEYRTARQQIEQMTEYARTYGAAPNRWPTPPD